MTDNVIKKLITKLKDTDYYRRLMDLQRFDDGFYLDYYADVRQGIERGDFKSAKEHFIRCGFKEGRVSHHNRSRLLSRKFGVGVEPVGIPLELARGQNQALIVAWLTPGGQAGTHEIGQFSNARFPVLSQPFLAAGQRPGFTSRMSPSSVSSGAAFDPKIACHAGFSAAIAP
jgi:hypothetical protein